MSERHSTPSKVRFPLFQLIDYSSTDARVFHPAVRLYDPATGEGVGALDFLDNDEKSLLLQSKLAEDVIEKWWCLGDVRNRVAVWVQGNKLL